MVLKIESKKDDPKTLILSWEGEVWKTVSKSLFVSELRKIPCHVGKEEFLQIFSQIEEKVGKRYAMYLLSQRAMLSSELEAKLVLKGLSSRAAKVVAGHCVDQGYIDDTYLIGRLVAKELKKGQSSRAVLFKLRQKKGLNEKVLREHLQSAEQTDQEVLKRWLEKNAKKIDRSDPDAMRKLMAKLMRRGFPADLVIRTLYNS